LHRAFRGVDRDQHHFQHNRCRRGDSDLVAQQGKMDDPDLPPSQRCCQLTVHDLLLQLLEKDPVARIFVCGI